MNTDTQSIERYSCLPSQRKESKRPTLRPGGRLRLRGLELIGDDLPPRVKHSHVAEIFVGNVAIDLQRNGYSIRSSGSGRREGDLVREILRRELTGYGSERRSRQEARQHCERRAGHWVRPCAAGGSGEK